MPPSALGTGAPWAGWGAGLVFGPTAWLLTYAVHSSVLLGGAWLLVRVLRGDRARERAWKAALLGALLTTTVQVQLALDPFGGRWLLRRGDAGSAPAAMAGEAPRRVVLEPSTEPLLRTPAIPGLDAPPRTVPAQTAPPSAPWPLGRVLLAWASGAGLGLALVLRSLRRWQRSIRLRTELRRGATFAAFEGLRRRAGLARPLRLFVAPDVLAPTAFGILRPAIALPPRVLDLRPEDQQAILAHELAHAVRRDPLWHLLTALLEVLFFFQPLQRLARARLHELAEFQCDDWAVSLTRRRLPLARSLTEVAGWIVARRRPGLVPSMAARGSALARRVERILDDRRAPAAVARPGGVLVASLALSAAALVLPGVAAEDRVAAERNGSREGGVRVPAGPSTAAASTSAPEGLFSALGALDRELAALREELRASRDLVAGSGLPQRWARRVEDLEQRLERLDGRRAQLEAALASIDGALRRSLGSAENTDD